MKCKEAKILLSAGIDGALTPGEKLVLEKHVSSCAECAKDKAEFARLSGAMPLWADEEPSPWLADKFADKLAQLQEGEPALVPQRRYRWGTLGAATAGFAAVVLAIGLLIHSNVPPAKEASPAKPRIEQMAKVVPPPLTIGDTQVAEDTSVVSPPPPTIRNTGGGRNLGIRNVPRAETPKPKPPVSVATVPTSPSPPQPAEGMYDVTYAGTAAVAKSTISENLGEASLAMNDTIERVRGNLQKSVDLMISQPPVPVTDSSHANGGIR